MIEFMRKHKLKLVSVVLLLIFMAGIVWLNADMGGILGESRERSIEGVENIMQDFRPGFASDFQWRMLGDVSNVSYERARINKIVAEDIVPDSTWDSGLYVGSQELNAEILSGVHKGEYVPISNSLTLLGNIHLKEQGEFIVRIHEDEEGGGFIAEVFAYSRVPALLGVIGLFFLLLIGVGGKKGLKSLAGLVFTMVCVFYVFIPLIFKGVNPLLSAAVIAALTSFVTFILTGGSNRKSAAAIIGTIFGVIAAAVVAWLVAKLASITMMNTSEAGAIAYLAYDLPIKVSGILFAGIIIAALGAVMDVGMSIASAVNEIHEASGVFDWKRLFQSGMNVGKDIIGTMSNTLILAFTGASLNVLLVLYAYNLPLDLLLNFDILAVPILEAVAGSFGIILTVPITAFAATLFIVRKGVRT